MSYRYEFDDAWDGNLRLRRAGYEFLQGAYRGLRDELETWNRRALEHGGSTPPYEQEWDVFISHADEDKEDFVRPLARALHGRGLSVWFDELTLTVGDSLRRSIDLGLARSRFGVLA